MNVKKTWSQHTHYIYVLDKLKNENINFIMCKHSNNKYKK